MNDKKHFVRGGLAATIGIVLVHFLVPGGWGWIFSPLRRAAAAGGTWAEALVSVPVWVLCVLWALILTALGAAILMVLSRRRKVDVAIPSIIKAAIFGLRWRWKYREGELVDLTCHCPK